MSTVPTTEIPGAPEKLDLYTLRDDVARQYHPANPLEVMLVTQIAQAWVCLLQAYETQRRYFQAHDVLDAIATQFQQYKAVTHEVTNCERIWRHAILHLERLQRQRLRKDSQEPRPRFRQEPEPIPAASREPNVSQTRPPRELREVAVQGTISQPASQDQRIQASGTAQASLCESSGHDLKIRRDSSGASCLPVVDLIKAKRS